ncbi:MAG TPA: twin-arginine translocase TatA/TatE family subunit [Pyrinomonadaceae bacterium]|jgi:sec-independent protein translocase protein TatA
MPNIGITELIIILVILLLLFGSSRLPQLARGMGKSINEFKKGIGEGGSSTAAESERELADARREQLREGEHARQDDLTSDKFTADKPR